MVYRLKIFIPNLSVCAKYNVAQFLSSKAMKQILIIDDDASYSFIIAEFLKLNHFQTRIANNGIVGINLAQRYHPDLIICDLYMPELDGYEVLKQIRQDSETKMIPLLFLTSENDSDARQLALELGADDYLTKTIEIKELLAKIFNRLPQK
jgi:DNA-binding response OmpR family regulator